MTIDPLRPPAQAEAYVSVLGVDGAIAFLLAFGGTEIYLARNPQARSRVAALVGRDKAEALAVACEGLPRRVPLCKPSLVNRLAKLTPHRRPKLTPFAPSRSGPEPTELITEWRRIRP